MFPDLTPKTNFTKNSPISLKSVTNLKTESKEKEIDKSVKKLFGI